MSVHLQAQHATRQEWSVAPRTGAPLVSVVVIFFDEERFLDEAIASVFAQTYANWELLLVDDGSSDGSGAIARRWAARYPERVRYVQHPGHENRGMSASRNLGLRYARGELIGFLDGDDVWLPHKLEEQVALLSARPGAGMVYGRTESWYSWSGKAEDRERDVLPELGVEPGKLLAAEDLLRPMLERQVRSPCTCSMLVRREVVEAVGGFEDGFRGMYEDQVFVAKVNLMVPVLAADRCWSRYRRHDDSCVSAARASNARRPARISFLKWLKRHVARRGLRGTEVWRATRRELRLTRGAAMPHLVDQVKQAARRAVSALERAAGVLPPPLRQRLLATWRGEEYTPPAGYVRFGSLRRLQPISRRWGKDRGGLPIDRYYIERFLAAHAADIRGRVLEVGDDGYTRRFGGSAVTRSDVLHVLPDNPKATIVADLTDAGQVPSDAFDCIVLTQVLQCIDDPPAAIRTLHRILRPGGVLLVTASGISQISRFDMERWGEFWRFTTLGLQRLLTAVFPPDDVAVESFGNVLSAVAFLQGLAAQELRPGELDHHDAGYELLLAARAVKPLSV